MDFTYTPLQKLFPKRGTPHEFNPGKFRMAIEFTDIARDILETEVRIDDIWLTGFPRVGATWCQEIVWLIRNNLNFDAAATTIQHLRFPRIELSAYNNESFDKPLGIDSVTYAKSMPSPRLIKTNVPFELLPKQLMTIKPKIIYMTRNPKDTWCSYYRYVQSFHDFRAPFQEAAATFCRGELPFGNMLDHCIPFWNRRHDKNILFLEYEDMRFNTKKIIRILADFLEVPLTNLQIDQIHDYVSLENMKNNPAVNLKWYWEKVKSKDSKYTFIYKGEVGGWKNNMSTEVSKMFDDWIDEKTKGTGLKFKYE